MKFVVFIPEPAKLLHHPHKADGVVERGGPEALAGNRLHHPGKLDGVGSKQPGGAAGKKNWWWRRGRNRGNDQGMRIFGFSLLGSGFAWLCFSAVMVGATVNGVISDTLKVTNRREPFTPQEVFDLAAGQHERFHDRLPWIFTPALVMLSGGILLSHRPRPGRASGDNMNPVS